MVLLAGLLTGCLELAHAVEANPSQASSGIVVYAAGDIADCRRVPPDQSGAAETAALIEGELARNDRAIVLSLGDHTYPDGHPSEFERCYQATWGQFKDRTYPTPGNHEYRTHAAQGYFGYFGTAAGDRQRGYYRFKVGDWQIISLNSNLSGTAFSAQLEWLKSTLAQNTAHCTLAYWHHPVFSSGSHGNEDIMLPAWRMLADAKVELVLSAHDHHYERFAPMNADGRRDDAQGTRQFIIGTGGARLTKFRLFKRHSEATGNTSHGVLKLVLQPGRYTWEFMPTRPGTQTDLGSDSCR
jgi:acid phosphatase type 7